MSRRERKTSIAAAKYAASPGRVSSAHPMAAPPTTGHALDPVRTQSDVVTNARASHIVVGVCPKNVAAWNAKSGESPTTATAIAASRPPKCARVTYQMETSAMTASTGEASHGAPACIASAISADVPGGYFERTHASTTTWSTRSSSACAGAGACSKPRAKSSACRKHEYSSPENGKARSATRARTA